MKQEIDADNFDNKTYSISWHNNIAAKVVFVSEWLILIIGMIYMGGGDGSGAGFFVIAPFWLFWLIHLIISVFIKRDKLDRIFSLINIILPLLLLLLILFQGIMK